MESGEYKTISLMDPAVDRARMPVEEQLAYVRTRDLALLNPYLIPGLLPVVFHFREIRHQIWRSFIVGDDAIEAKHARAFQAGLVRVENFTDEHGSIMRSWTPPTHANGVMTEDAVGKFAWVDIIEIGSVVYQKSPLRPGTEQIFHPALSWFDIWDHQARPRAAANPDSPAPTSSSPSPERAAGTAPSSATQTPTPSTGATSAVPTDVIAADQSGVAA